LENNTTYMSFREEQQKIGKTIIHYLINDAITTYTNYACTAMYINQNGDDRNVRLVK
jgi:hypothetical protein